VRSTTLGRRAATVIVVNNYHPDAAYCP